VEASNDADNRLSTLILLGEVLIATPLPASIKLVAALLETLSAVTQVSAVAEGETAYAQQLLMTVLEGAVTPLVVSYILSLPELNSRDAPGRAECRFPDCLYPA
jgi:hypothetical protein